MPYLSYRQRIKNSAAYLLKHINVQTTKAIVEQSPYKDNGPEIFDYVMAMIIVPLYS